tara:strand:- start:224 stop:514 length:291 start_codon:yes stop_codon:yes gene_type:complete
MTVTQVITNAVQEQFTNTNANANANNNTNNNNSNGRRPNMLVSLIVFTIYLILVLLVGKYLWNECLCKVITVCKPVQDIFTLLGVILLVDLIHPRI